MNLRVLLVTTILIKLTAAFKNPKFRQFQEISEKLSNPRLAICITGVSNSGKTYFANIIQNVLKSNFQVETEIVHQDYFFMPIDITPVEILKFNNSESENPIIYPRFEEVLSYDWTGLWEYASNVVKKERNNRVVIIEGSIILQAKRAFKLCDRVFEIKVDFETALKRRQARKDYADMYMTRRDYVRDITWVEHAKYMEIAEILAGQSGKEIVKIRETEITAAQNDGDIVEFVLNLLFLK